MSWFKDKHNPRDMDDEELLNRLDQTDSSHFHTRTVIKKEVAKRGISDKLSNAQKRKLRGANGFEG